ncbi:MAG: hypothetical protein MZU79_01520 [Anaerotruncus sp.]|nr:hypothetical protein [Anaerotruncus sp.]
MNRQTVFLIAIITGTILAFDLFTIITNLYVAPVLEGFGLPDILIYMKTAVFLVLWVLFTLWLVSNKTRLNKANIKSLMIVGIATIAAYFVSLYIYKYYLLGRYQLHHPLSDPRRESGARPRLLPHQLPDVEIHHHGLQRLQLRTDSLRRGVVLPDGRLRDPEDGNRGRADRRLRPFHVRRQALPDAGLVRACGVPLDQHPRDALRLSRFDRNGARHRRIHRGGAGRRLRLPDFPKPQLRMPAVVLHGDLPVPSHHGHPRHRPLRRLVRTQSVLHPARPDDLPHRQPRSSRSSSPS